MVLHLNCQVMCLVRVFYFFHKICYFNKFSTLWCCTLTVMPYITNVLAVFYYYSQPISMPSKCCSRIKNKLITIWSLAKCLHVWLSIGDYNSQTSIKSNMFQLITMNSVIITGTIIWECHRSIVTYRVAQIKIPQQ